MDSYFTRKAKQNLRAGREKMESKLTDLQKSWRTFAAGRPASYKLDAINVLATFSNLRDKLEDQLKRDGTGEIISAAIAFTSSSAPEDKPGLTTPPIIKGKEDETLKFLLGVVDPRMLGALFTIKHADEKRLFAYPLDRSESSLEILDWLWKRQMETTESE